MMQTATHTETLVADHAVLKKLGRWTEATSFAVRARRSSVVLDLRALDSEISESGAAIEVAVDADHSVITLLVASDSPSTPMTCAGPGAAVCTTHGSLPPGRASA